MVSLWMSKTECGTWFHDAFSFLGAGCDAEHYCETGGTIFEFFVANKCMQKRARHMACDHDKQCADGLKCGGTKLFSKCIIPCGKKQECPPEMYCQTGGPVADLLFIDQCVEQKKLNESCFFDQECGAGLHCTGVLARRCQEKKPLEDRKQDR